MVRDDDDLREIFLQRPTRKETDFEFLGGQEEQEEEEEYDDDCCSQGTVVNLSDFETADEREEEDEPMEEDLAFVAADDSE